MSKFTVRTIDGEKHSYTIATDYHTTDVGIPKLVVIGDDDFEDGPITLRVFNLEHVIDYGWER